MPTAVMEPIFVQSDEVTCHAMGVIRLARGVVVSATPPVGGILGTENINVAEVSAAGAQPFGFARYAGILDDQIPIIRANWIVQLVVGATPVVAGNRLALDNQGRVIPYVGTADATTNPFIVGIALESNAVADTLVGVALQCF
jgi:hypothetical protein